MEGGLSHSLESVVRCLVGRIEGMTVLVLSVGSAGGEVGFDQEAEVDVAIMLSAIVRRRVPARILGL